MSLSKYHNLFTKYLEDYHQKENPKGLYEPISYILSLGGKRLRPLLTLMATEAFGKDANEALAAALSVEIFHNFTLMHDDGIVPSSSSVVTLVNRCVPSEDSLALTATSTFRTLFMNAALLRLRFCDNSRGEGTCARCI